MPRTPDAATTTVLFIECQNGLLGAGSALPGIADAARPVIPAMARLAAGARRAGATVAHLTFVSAFANRAANRRPPLFFHMVDGLADWTAGHPATEPIPEIGVGPDDLVLPRHTGINPTGGTETFRILRNAGIGSVVLAGISVNVAMMLVAGQAADEDFDVHVPSDAVAGAPPEHVASMLQHSLSMIARITTVDALLDGWGVS